jgi:hypothetical protein
MKKALQMQRLAGDKNELEDFEEWTIDEDDSEISGDCNESQPLRIFRTACSFGNVSL